MHAARRRSLVRPSEAKPRPGAVRCFAAAVGASRRLRCGARSGRASPELALARAPSRCASWLRSVLRQAGLVVSPYGEPIPRPLLRSSPPQRRSARHPAAALPSSTERGAHHERCCAQPCAGARRRASAASRSAAPRGVRVALRRRVERRLFEHRAQAARAARCRPREGEFGARPRGASTAEQSARRADRRSEAPTGTRTRLGVAQAAAVTQHTAPGRGVASLGERKHQPPFMRSPVTRSRPSGIGRTPARRLV